MRSVLRNVYQNVKIINYCVIELTRGWSGFALACRPRQFLLTKVEKV
jgi:hypothetical protein